MTEPCENMRAEVWTPEHDNGVRCGQDGLYREDVEQVLCNQCYEEVKSHLRQTK